MLNKLVAFVAIGIAASVIIGALFLQSGGIGSQTPQTNQSNSNYPTAEEEMAETLRQDAYSEAYNAEFAALEAKEGSLRQLVYADPSVKGHIAGAFSYQADVDYADITGLRNDELRIYVVGDRLPVEGDWRTSYKITYTGIFELKISIKGDQIVSMEKIPKEDKTYVKTFSDSEKEALELAFANPDVAAAVQGRDIIVLNVKPVSFGKGSGCPPGSCVFIYFEQPSTGKFLPLFFNTAEAKVFSMENGKGQIGEGW